MKMGIKVSSRFFKQKNKGERAAKSVVNEAAAEVENNIVIRLFLVLFAALMVAIVAAIHSIYIDKLWFYMTSCFFIAGIVLFCMLINKIEMTEKTGRRILLLLVVLGIALRWIMLQIMQTQPVSDLAVPHNFYDYYQQRGPYTEVVPWNQRDSYQLYYSSYWGWYMFMRVVKLVYDLFGRNMLWIQILNMVLAAGSMVLIYALIPSRKLAIIAVMLFAFEPSMIVDSCCLLPAHYAIFFILLAALFWMRAEKYRGEWPHSKKGLVYILCTALACALVNWFKPLSVFFLVVFVCFEVASYIYIYIRGRNGGQHSRGSLKQVLSYELVFALLLSGGIFAGNAIIKADVRNLLKTEAIDSTGLYLMWGTAINEEGNYDPNIASDEFFVVNEKYSGDYDLMFQEFMEIGKEWFKQNFSPDLVWQKIKAGFCSEYGFYGAANTSAVEGYASSVDQVLYTPLLLSMLSYMHILYILSCLYAIFMIVQKRIKKADLLIMIILFGYVCVLMISGIQHRYKSLVIPIWCILAGEFLGIVSQNFKRYVDSIRTFLQGKFKLKHE